jgi:hypothetical protein
MLIKSNYKLNYVYFGQDLKKCINYVEAHMFNYSSCAKDR